MEIGKCIVLVCLLLASCAGQKNNLDPTGTYKLVSDSQERDGEIFGYFGEIQVKRITTDEVAITFLVCKGAPSYNSGSFVDTLTYTNDRVIYTDPDLDESCKIFFDFDTVGVKVREEAKDLNSACGFGHAVIADGFYKKVSMREPKLKEPLTDEYL